MLKNASLILLSVACFFLGSRLGELRNHQQQAQCSSSYNVVTDVVSQFAASSPPMRCEDHGHIESAFEKASIKSDQTCQLFPTYNASSLQLGSASVPDEVFPFLHHPSSPAKVAFFFSQKPFDDQITGRTSVLNSPCNEIYLTRTGSRASQPNKCISVAVVPAGSESPVQQSHRIGYTALNTDQYQKDYPRDYHKKHNNENLLLEPLLREIGKLTAEFRRKLGAPVDEGSGKRRTAIVMVANEGVMDLLLNFLCSAEAALIDLSSVVVFVGDHLYISLVENMGVKGIYSPALGSMPAQAARGYLDETFSRMMWFKATSVYLALHSGFDVMFQDVDLVWLKNPFQHFETIDADILFMDDGARTPRYTPFFVNSGFYYVKHNERTLYMFETMMKCAASEIGQTHSHQSVLIRHIAEAHHLFGLKVYVLDTKLFPSGQTYHENKKQVQKIQSRTFRPYVFHMCWTSNREDKVVYFKDMKLWYLPDQASATTSMLSTANKGTCNDGRSMLRYAVTDGRRYNIRSKCCQRDRYWPPP